MLEVKHRLKVGVKLPQETKVYIIYITIICCNDCDLQKETEILFVSVALSSESYALEIGF